MNVKMIQQKIEKISKFIDTIDNDAQKSKYLELEAFVCWLQGYLSGIEEQNYTTLKSMKEAIDKSRDSQ